MFVNIATPKFAAQAIKKIAELEWKPMHLMTDVLDLDRRGDEAGRARGLRRRAVGRLSLKDAVRSAVEGRRGHEEVHAPSWTSTCPGANISDAVLAYGYAAAQRMVQVLKQCGDDLTRENVMKQAASLKDFAPDAVIPGIKINTGADGLRADRAAQDDGGSRAGQWELFGDIISAETERLVSIRRSPSRVRDSVHERPLSFRVAASDSLRCHDGKAETAHIADTRHRAGPCQSRDADFGRSKFSA